MILILIIILLIIVVYLYNQTLIETKKEKYNTTNLLCSKNCGNYNIDRTSTDVAGCLSCDSCGVCTLPNRTQMCLNGNINGAYFYNDCSGLNWMFGNSKNYQTQNNYNYYDYDYENQLRNLGQTTNLPSQVKDVSYEIEKTVPISKQLKTQTANALADLLNKINTSNTKNSIDKDTVQQLNQILIKLKNPKT
jgi:hypothetical protein